MVDNIKQLCGGTELFAKAVLVIIDKVVVIYVLPHRTSNTMFNQL